MKIPFLREDDIEQDAVGLLEQFYRRPVSQIQLPIEVEDILECHLKLRMAIEDLVDRFNLPDVLGALDVPANTVWVDSRLNPDEHPQMLNRYRFTVSHEIGHAVLHRSLFEICAPGQLTLNLAVESEPPILCRTSNEHTKLEWQANRFAAALLMPAPMIKQAWRTWLATIVLPNEQVDRWIEMDAFVREISWQYQVSMEAVRIRLDTLRLSNELIIPAIPNLLAS